MAIYQTGTLDGDQLNYGTGDTSLIKDDLAFNFQEVTDYGNTTTNDIGVSGNLEVGTISMLAPPDGGYADAARKLYWDEDVNTLSIGMDGEVTLQVGQEQYYYIKAAESISNGDVIYASGVVGGSTKIIGAKYIANNTIDELYVLGIATQDINVGEFGYVTQFGTARSIVTTGQNGETWNEGDILYASPTVYGGLTNVEPVAPNLDISMAIITNEADNGAIFVRPIRNSHLDELHDVHYPTTPSENQLLRWGASGRWENVNLTGISGVSVINSANSISIAHNNTSAQTSVDNSNGTVIQDVALDEYGHITGLGSVNLDSRYYTESEVDSITGTLLSSISTNASDISTLQGVTGTLASDISTNASDISTLESLTGSYLTTSTTFGGDVSGTYNNIVIADDSHNHIISNVDGLQTALDEKLATTGKAADSDKLDGQDGTYYYPASNPSGYSTSSELNATNDTSTTTLYPVMVGAAGSNQTPKVTTTATALKYNASTRQLQVGSLETNNTPNVGSGNTSSGTYSSAIGYSNEASGDSSSAVGYINTASGNFSSAFGMGNISNSLNSVAVGNGNRTLSTAHTSVSIGILNNTSGSTINVTTGVISGTIVDNSSQSRISSAVGIKNLANGFKSSAFGYANTAGGGSSSAIGRNNTASAYNSSAIGYINDASGSSSSAIGRSNIASAFNSSAFGRSNTASENNSSAFGYSNTASGGSSSAIGRSNTASGGSSSAFGRSNTASGINSSAFGYTNTASGSSSSAIGRSNTASAYTSSAIGYRNTASAIKSSAFGYANTASEINSSAFGRSNTASGINSSAIGYSNTASATSSSAFGYSNTATAFHSVAVGNQNRTLSTAYASVSIGILNNTSGVTINATTGQMTGNIVDNSSQSRISSAVGIKNLANGLYSSAFGYANTASGYKSSAIGYNNTASGDYSSVFGHYTKVTVNNVQELGYWSNSTTRNASVRIHGTAGTGYVAISLDNTATAYTDGGATAGSEADDTLMREAYALRRDGTDLYVDFNAGGTITTKELGAGASDIRLKTNVVKISNPIDKVKQLEGFTYNYNSLGQQLYELNPDKKHIGVSAQTVLKTLPEAAGVFSKVENTDFYYVKYEKLVPLLIEAIKEQQTQIDQLKAVLNIS